MLGRLFIKSMNQSSKVNSQGKVPFLCENKTGFPMVTNQKSAKEKYLLQKLPLPACLSESTRKSFHDIQIPLPPCTFQPSSRSCSRKGLKRQGQDDPFLAAYKECTRATHKGKLSQKGVGFGLKRGMFGFSCKQFCSVRDGDLVLTSLIPIEKEGKEVVINGITGEL